MFCHYLQRTAAEFRTASNMIDGAIADRFFASSVTASKIPLCATKDDASDRCDCSCSERGCLEVMLAEREVGSMMRLEI